MKILPENFCSKGKGQNSSRLEEEPPAVRTPYSYLRQLRNLQELWRQSLCLSGGHYKNGSVMIQAPAVLLDC